MCACIGVGVYSVYRIRCVCIGVCVSVFVGMCVCRCAGRCLCSHLTFLHQYCLPTINFIILL